MQSAIYMKRSFSEWSDKNYPRPTMFSPTPPTNARKRAPSRQQGEIVLLAYEKKKTDGTLRLDEETIKDTERLTTEKIKQRLRTEGRDSCFGAKWLKPHLLALLSLHLDEKESGAKLNASDDACSNCSETDVATKTDAVVLGPEDDEFRASLSDDEGWFAFSFSANDKEMMNLSVGSFDDSEEDNDTEVDEDAETSTFANYDKEASLPDSDAAYIPEDDASSVEQNEETYARPSRKKLKTSPTRAARLPRVRLRMSGRRHADFADQRQTIHERHCPATVQSTSNAECPNVQEIEKHTAKLSNPKSQQPKAKACVSQVLFPVERLLPAKSGTCDY